MDMTLSKHQEIVKDMEAWHAADHWATEQQIFHVMNVVVI